MKVWRLAGRTAVILGGLAILGALVSPPWDPRPVRDHLIPETPSTVIGATQQGIQDGRIHRPGDFEVLTTEVTIELDGYTVGGLLREPIGAEAAPDTNGLTGIAFVHGAGTGLASEAFTAQAEQLASAGIVTLVPDKRLDTYSIFSRDYVTMADDYLRSVEFLRAWPGVDPELVGVYGESEGTWIVPVMQALDPSIAFTILVSAPVVPPRVQAAFAVDNYLRHAGVPTQVFRAIPRALGIPFPLGLLDYADFDVIPWLRQQSAPIMVVYGAVDPSMPIDQGSRIIIAETAIGGRGAPVTVRFYAGADHGLRIDGIVVPELSRDIAAWAQGLPETADAEPRIAGAAPLQEFEATAVPSPVWWLNGNVVFGSLIVGLLLLLVSLSLWLSTARSRHSHARRAIANGEAPAVAMNRGVPALLLALGLSSTATLVALVIYLMAVASLALNDEQSAWTVQGGWAGVRLLGVVTVVCVALLIDRAHRSHEAKRADEPHVSLVTGWLAHLTFWTALTGSAIVTLWLTYWGVYQLGL
ncbi:MAG: alpha/beta hydrolase [Promicromonosporaceae bacterium]|nr:alpha/beta hydrolase [Promicromonosporaceae bacterium]